ncbi:MAG: F0F1 ATP synthase subunit B [Chloroflexi bacterium]|nr:F0F1 ATP synthase subunit B [Chloroflexota bacterium]
MEQLGINVQGLVAQIINFFLLLVILRAVAYKPITRMLDQRAAKIRDSMENAEQIKLQLARAQEDYAAHIDQARKDAQSIVSQANQMAERVRQEAQSQARQEAEQFLSKAEAQIERDKRQAISELRKEVADLAILAAGKVVGKSLDDKAHYAVIEQVLSESDKLSNN